MADASIEVTASLTDDDLRLALKSALRREVLGGLIRYLKDLRYLKDGETDLGKLLFHYVHIEDYGQAMVEGWGELHALLVVPKVGAMGLPYEELGGLAQEICAAIADREEYTKKEILDKIAEVDFDEGYWWEAAGGDIIDRFQDWINLGG
jgi:hypothetical protein